MVKRAFNKVQIGGALLWDLLEAAQPRGSLEQLVQALEYLHLNAGLLMPYGRDYPLVEPRELIPPFDAPLIEYRHLPAFSMVALDRGLSYQDEGFQYDQMLPQGPDHSRATAALNRQSLRNRMPRNLLPRLEQVLGHGGPTPVRRYVRLLPLLMQMDRGHVIARDPEGIFFLAGIFASFPSDLDGEIKRFGRQIGKFQRGDNRLYAENRQFVYSFLLEQLGFPICGERHTSAALFARRLLRRRESFVVKVLGHSDRAVTTFTSLGAVGGLPRVEKVALVAATGCSQEGRRRLSEGGFYVDQERGAVLLRVCYNQHAYHPDNVLEDRALSVASQEVIHPQTGQRLSGLDVLGLGQDRVLLLNDIVRGEYQGSIVYQGRERVQGTADTNRRLKFLAAWLGKHRHILADYSPEYFERCLKVVSSYLGDPRYQAEFRRNQALYQQVRRVLERLRLAHRLRLIEKLVANRSDAFGRQFKHVQILIILVHVLSTEGQDLAARHPLQLRKLLSICRRYLDNPYLRRRYLSKPPGNTIEREVVGHYRLLSRLLERFQPGRGVDARPGAA
ncbi:MAG: hypothetical protein AB1814_08120 [Thermodesulfobacteriota bacterium]